MGDDVLNDVRITEHIIRRHSKELLSMLNADVVVVGAGPSGMVCASILADNGLSTLIIERRLSIGGGIWGGGIGFPVIVVQESAVQILRDAGIAVEHAGEDYYTANAVEVAVKLCAYAIDKGARILNCMHVEDVLIKDNRVAGVVVNSSAIAMAGLHVDPVTIGARYVVDATGHDASVCNVVAKKVGGIEIKGEGAMCAHLGEMSVVENSKEVFPGLFVAGMAANAVFGAPRMGPIFGGMFLSGKKIAEEILKKEEGKT